MATRKTPAAVARGRRGGKVKSAAKAASSQRNAQFAGRKPKFTVGDACAPNERAPKDYRGRLGLITELGPGRSEYRVEFEDGRQPTTGYLMSWWLDRV